jgi:tetratricopeptide (TPR) repeat protein
MTIDSNFPNLRFLHRLIFILGTVGVFLGTIALTFYFFNTFKLDVLASSIISISVATFIVFIIMGISGMLKEFSIKSPLFEITSSLKERINEVKDNLDESKKEINEKISALNQNIQYISNRFENITSSITQSTMQSKTDTRLTAQVDNNIEGVVKEMRGLFGDFIEQQSKIQGYRTSDVSIDWITKMQEKQDKIADLISTLSLNNSRDYEIESYLDKGLINYNEGKYEQAIQMYNLVLQKDPNNIAALTNKGNTLNSMGNYQEALIVFQKATQQNPNYIPALLNIGTTHILIGNYEESIRYLDNVLKSDPNNAIVFNNKAKALFALGRTDEAEMCVKRAIELNPHLARIWKLNKK